MSFIYYRKQTEKERFPALVLFLLHLNFKIHGGKNVKTRKSEVATHFTNLHTRGSRNIGKGF